MSKKAKVDVWSYNFAQDEKVRNRVLQFMPGRLTSVRYARRAMEENLIRFYNMWNITKDSYHGYKGRAQLYIPEVRKNVEAQARQLTEAAFPNEDFFEASPGETGTKRGSKAWTSIMRWNIENSKLRMKYLVHARQMAMLGTSPVYVPWMKRSVTEFRSVKNYKTKKIEPKRHQIDLFNGPDFIVRDLLKWYAFNPKKADILDDGCFEDYVVGNADLVREDKAGLLYDRKVIEEGSSNAYVLEQLERDVERAEQMGLNILSNEGYAGEATLKDVDLDEFKDDTHLCTLIHTNMVMPEMCDEEDDPELPIPIQIKFYDNQYCGLIRRNPFYHQTPPYLIGKYILPNPDEFYGQGIPHATQYMQYEMNSTAEQTMDSKTLSLNPMVIVDPGMAGQGSEYNAEPGAIWWGSPNGIKPITLPDVTGTGYMAINQLRSQMQDYSDRSPALPPELLGKSRTATQSQIVSDTMSIDNKTFQIQNEQMVLEPLLSMWESLIDQNMKDDQIIMILGRRSTDLKRTMMKKKDLLGRYRYFWKGSSGMQNRQIMARQWLDFLKVIGTLPPNLQPNLNKDEFAKVLISDIFQLKDADKVIGQPEEFASQDAEVENRLVDLGFEIEVLPNDSDDEHIPVHNKAFEKEKDAVKKAELATHMQMHMKQKQAKQQAAQQQAQMMQMQMQMAQAQGQQGGQRRSRGSGNRTQLSPNSSAGNMGSGTRA